MLKINPFKPGSPVHPGMFAGRIDEIKKVERILFQAKKSFARHFLVYGERGIGKTSFLQYVKFVAKGLIDVESQRLRFLVVETEITKETTRKGLIGKINLNLKSELGGTEAARSNFEKLWDFTKRLEACGVKLSKSDDNQENELLEEEFSISLAETIKRITTPNDSFFSLSANFDGVLFLFDEVDKANDGLNIGSFFKLLQERLQRRGVEKLVIGISGLPEVFSVLYESHQSSLRLFEEIPLKRLTRDEICYVITKCLKEAKELNSVEMQITEEGKSYLAAFSEGFPHFIQQFGHSAFDYDKDWVLDKTDIINSAFGSGGALEAIGRVYYKKDFYQKIQSPGYRQVLRIMADKMDSWITRKEIKSQFKGTEGVLNNAISALINRNITACAS